jgi:excisionase family DNA binding protein
MSDRLLTVAEVAERLAVQQWAVRGMIRRGELEAVRIGRLYRVTEQAYFEMLDARRVQPDEPKQPAQSVPRAEVQTLRAGRSFRDSLKRDAA